MNKPLVSIITVVYNNEKFIADAIESVISQNYPHIEYIVVDGGSTDNTLSIIDNYKDNIDYLISEPDKGVFDALNKGIQFSTGDIIGILHSDDVYNGKYAITTMIDAMLSNSSEIVFSDMLLMDKQLTKVIRYYRASYFYRCLLKTGWLPPHPTWFVRKNIFQNIGEYSNEFKYAGDFEYSLRIFANLDIKYSHVKGVTVLMRSGGLSNSGVANKLLLNREIEHALRLNGIRPIRFLLLLRYIIRSTEFVFNAKTIVKLMKTR